MVMENEIRLGDIMDKLTPSDRVVIYNAARQVVYRLYIRIELKSEFER